LNPTFAAACVVAAAILVHAFASRPSDVALQQVQIEAAVAKAVAAVETRQTAELRAAYEMYDKQFKKMYITTNGIVRQ
jgi:hypothetical protein